MINYLTLLALIIIPFSFNYLALNVELKGQYGKYARPYIAVRGQYVYTSFSTGLNDLNDFNILDVSNPYTPVLKSVLYTPDYIGEIEVVNHYAYLANSKSLRIIDVNDPTKPKEVGVLEETIKALIGISVVGKYAYLADRDVGLRIVDISDPTQPQEVGLYDITINNGDKIQHINDVMVVGNYAYLSTTYYLLIVDVSNPADPILVSKYALPNDGGTIYVNGCVALLTGRGLHIFDVSNPANPQWKSTYDMLEAQDIFLADNYAYVANFSTGLRVLDVSNLASPAEVGFFRATSVNPWTEGVMVANGYVYVADGEVGILILQHQPPKVAMPREQTNCVPVAVPVAKIYLPVIIK